MVDISKIKNPIQIEPKPFAERAISEGLQQQSWRYSVDGQVFDYKKGRVHINKQDLGELINENLSHLGAHYWTVLAKRLGRYRDWASLTVEDPEELGHFLALVSAYLAKIFGRIKKKFDETIDGISFHLEDGQLLLNGVNVSAVVDMARRNPLSRNGKIFLKGLKRRLEVLQANRGGNVNYEKVRGPVEEMIASINVELTRFTPTIIELPPASASLISENSPE